MGDATTELIKQGGLAVGLAAVMMIGGWVVKLLKSALDREAKRNDAMREDLADLTEGVDKLVTALQTVNSKLDALNVRFDALFDRRRS